jgi:hypothetical protein
VVEFGQRLAEVPPSRPIIQSRTTRTGGGSVTAVPSTASAGAWRTKSASTGARCSTRSSACRTPPLSTTRSRTSACARGRPAGGWLRRSAPARDRRAPPHQPDRPRLPASHLSRYPARPLAPLHLPCHPRRPDPYPAYRTRLTAITAARPTNNPHRLNSDAKAISGLPSRSRGPTAPRMVAPAAMTASPMPRLRLAP